MNKNIATECECRGTGFIAVADSGGDGVDYVECAKHHPALDKICDGDFVNGVCKTCDIDLR